MVCLCGVSLWCVYVVCVYVVCVYVVCVYVVSPGGAARNYIDLRATDLNRWHCCYDDDDHHHDG